jgi:hypothetical protein
MENRHQDISSSERDHTKTLSAIPLHRVYEMRGTLFYEINGNHASSSLSRCAIYYPCSMDCF